MRQILNYTNKDCVLRVVYLFPCKSLISDDAQKQTVVVLR